MQRGPVLLALVVALAACSTPAPPTRITTWREPGTLTAATMLGERPELRVALLGDFGDPTPRQASVAGALFAWNERHPFDLVLQPGDDLYSCGPDPALPGAERCAFAADGATVAEGFVPPADPTFRRNEAALEGLRRPDGADTPVYLALGNHDVGAPRSCRVPGVWLASAMRRRACLEVAHRSPQWRMPGRHYVLDEGRVRFIVVDSNVAVGTYGGFTLAAEEAFVREASAPCAERLCFMVAHHPPAAAAAGPLQRTEPSMTRMRRLAAAADGRLAAVLAGHVHTLEQLTLPGLDVIVTGSGSRGGDYAFAIGWPPEARLRFASTAPGFGVLEIWDGGWGLRLVDDQERALHCCEARGRGPCEPVACPDAG